MPKNNKKQSQKKVKKEIKVQLNAKQKEKINGLIRELAAI